MTNYYAINTEQTSKLISHIDKFLHSVIPNIFIIICGALRDLVPFVQFKKSEKHPWRSVTFKLKVTLLHGCFSRFLNCTNCTKSRNALDIVHYPVLMSKMRKLS